jgi:probable F420-dependent oxidoreductase
MQFGVVFPQTEFGSDPHAVRDYAQAAESAGLNFVEAYDHILGANPERPGGWHGPYTFKSSFIEPFILFTYMAAFTQQLGLATNIIILPQRQTALVAKQAATLDVLSGGRLRLGVGLGWNEVEYVALNENFHTRGRRIEEQVQVLRALWTQELVDFKGKWHTILDAGLNPLPVQRPIPVWFGGRAPEAIRRIARLGDGWMTNFRSPAEAKPLVEQFYRELEAAGRDRAGCPIEVRLPYAEGKAGVWHSLMREWQTLGATWFSVNTMASGFTSPAQHVEAIQKFARAMVGTEG